MPCIAQALSEKKANSDVLRHTSTYCRYASSRLDRLEAKGLIERVPHPTDRRSVEVQLTDDARTAVDKAVTVHVHNEQQMLAPLSEPEVESLNRITSKLIGHLSSDAWRTSD
jgi:DNA-binding MarR family transcriptional regulator